MSNDDEPPRPPKPYGSQSSVAVDTAARIYRRPVTTVKVNAAVVAAVANGSIDDLHELVDTAVAALDDDADVPALVANASDRVRPALAGLDSLDRRSFLRNLAGRILGGAAAGVSEGVITGWLFETDQSEPTIVNEVMVDLPDQRDEVPRSEGDAMWAEIARLAKALEEHENKRGRKKDDDEPRR